MAQTIASVSNKLTSCRKHLLNWSRLQQQETMRSIESKKLKLHILLQRKNGNDMQEKKQIKKELTLLLEEENLSGNKEQKKISFDMEIETPNFFTPVHHKEERLIISTAFKMEMDIYIILLKEYSRFLRITINPCCPLLTQLTYKNA